MAAPGPGELRWRCRRGMRELDLLLLRFLEHDGYARLDEGLRPAFLRLLDLSDQELLALLLGHTGAVDPEIHRVVERIRRPAGP